MQKTDFDKFVVDAIKYHGGEAHLLDVAKYIWDNYEKKLRDSGPYFYTWQYDMRWAATRLRKAGVMVAANQSKQGMWVLKG